MELALLIAFGSATLGAVAFHFDGGVTAETTRWTRIATACVYTFAGAIGVAIGLGVTDLLGL